MPKLGKILEYFFLFFKKVFLLLYSLIIFCKKLTKNYAHPKYYCYFWTNQARLK